MNKPLGTPAPRVKLWLVCLLVLVAGCASDPKGIYSKSCHCPKPLTYEDIILMRKKYCFQQEIKVYESGISQMAMKEYEKTGCEIPK